jgi:PHD/YefM family antitoxin component YafN of YafNO toxin-antitoxin module
MECNIIGTYIRPKWVHNFVREEGYFKMIRSTNVSSLRSDLASHLKDLAEGPILILSHSRPVAMLLEPEMFESLVEKIELLEDIVDGRRAVEDIRVHPDHVIDAEEAFERLGH